jgi:hypothetical protein
MGDGSWIVKISGQYWVILGTIVTTVRSEPAQYYHKLDRFCQY